MQPAKAFKELLNTNAKTLKRQGFSPGRQTFYLRRAENWGLINFQRSRESGAEEVVFTINLGIASGRLLQFFPPARLRAVSSNAKPDIWECHWQERLSYLLPRHEDTWWKITTKTQVEQQSVEIQGYLLNLAIPEIEKYVSDEALRDLWLAGTAPGLTKLQRLEYLSVLINYLGPPELLEPTLEELRRVTDDAEIHIQRLARAVIK